jgi:hypothetical protein
VTAYIGKRAQSGRRERGHEQICIIIPVLVDTSFDRMANVPEAGPPRYILYFHQQRDLGE